jgi:uncharacterized protein
VPVLVSMLHWAAHHLNSHPILFVHGARNGQHHPFKEEVLDLAKRHANIQVHTIYSAPDDNDVVRAQFTVQGRISAELVKSLDPPLDAQFYVCGPTGFMSSLISGLITHGVSRENIYTESFGPSAP